jgi:hypothetical protein
MAGTIFLPWSKWKATVDQAQSDWQRGLDQQAAGVKTAKAALNEKGAADLTALLTPLGAPVGTLLPKWQAVADQSGLTLADFSKGANDYFTNITNPDGNARWWGADAWYRVPLQGAAIANPGFDWSKYIDRPHELAQQNEIGVRLTAEQQTHGSKGLGALGAIAAIAGIVTGGLSLVGAFADAAIGASLAETAATAAAAGDAGFIGAAGAAELSSASAGLSISSAAGLAKNAFSVANGFSKLATGTAAAATIGATSMANPLYLVNQDTATSTQGAAPQQPGAATTGAAVAAARAPALGLSQSQLALLAVAAVAAYAFWDHSKG